MRPKKLLAIDTNAKTVKGQKKGYMTGILYLAPADMSGFNVCPQASAGCKAACLNTAGRGAFSNVQASRLSKTLWYFNDRASFMSQLVKDIDALIRKANREGFIPVVRLNGTSDIPWERIPVAGMPNIMALYPDVQFYDYTKITKRAVAHALGEMPDNYHLTFSATEANGYDCDTILLLGGNVAAVYRVPPEGMGKHGYVNGDESDLRFLDPAGVTVVLKAKGKARKDTSGFVR